MPKVTKLAPKKTVGRPRKAPAPDPVLEQVPEITQAGKIEYPSDRVIKLDNLGRTSTKDAAMLLGVTDRTLRNWRKDGCLSIYDGGLVDIAGVWRWRESKIETQAERDRADIIEATGGLTLEQVQVRHEIAKTRLTEIKLAREMGLLIPIEPYIHALSTLLGEVCSILDRLPKSKAPELSEEKTKDGCEKILRDEVEKLKANLMVEIAMSLDRNKSDPYAEADREAAEQEAADREAEDADD